jgi:hypothetical protein
MKLILKIFGGIVLVLLAIILIFSSIYVYKHYPRKIDSFEVNDEHLPNKILIASQGSDFKNELLNHLVNKIDNDSTYIKVVHTSKLFEVGLDNWTTVVIINTCVADKLQKSVTNFLSKVPEDYPLYMVITAGDGRWMPADLQVDAISTASRLSKIDETVNSILMSII